VAAAGEPPELLLPARARGWAAEQGRAVREGERRKGEKEKEKKMSVGGVFV